MLISKDKSYTHPKPTVKLQGTIIKTSSNEMHLGIARTDDSANGETVSNQIKTATQDQL